MNRLKRALLWFRMLLKSQIKRISYLMILCLIPLLVYGMQLVAEQDSGVLTIALFQENPFDSVSSKTVEKLTGKNSVIRFTEVQSKDEAVMAVMEKKADAAWIFDGNMTEKLDEYTKGSKVDRGLIQVIELEDNIILQLTREKLFGALYPSLSYSLYRNFVISNLVETNLLEINEEQLRAAYDSNLYEDEIFELSFSGDTSGKLEVDKLNYLMTPLRGMLMMVIVLSSLAAQMYYGNDRQKGLFVWLPGSAEYLLSYGYQYAAMLPVCVVVFLAIRLSGLFTKVGVELVAMLLFTLMMAAFSNILRRLLKTVKAIGAAIPVLIIAMVSLSQIFIEVNSFRLVQTFLPTYYYIPAVHNIGFLKSMIIYCVIAVAIDGTTYICLERKQC